MHGAREVFIGRFHGVRAAEVRSSLREVLELVSGNRRSALEQIRQ
jgi:hypothetical protein